MSEEGIKKFFDIARERWLIKQRRDSDLPKPWSADPVFQNNRFCNVFREDDRTTVWFRENIRDPLNQSYALNPKIILLAIVAFRWFNRIETWDAVLSSGRTLEDIFADPDFISWLGHEIQDHCNPPYVTGAYIIKTPDGMDKLTGVLWCIDQFKLMMDQGKFDDIINGCGYCSHERAQELLEEAPFLGPFMGYQIIADARHTKLLDNSVDINSWAQPGPGSTRGIGRVFYGDVNKFRYGSKKDEKEVIKLMKELLVRSREERYWPYQDKPWEMQVVQNWCCETDKYVRCGEGGKMKRKFS